MQDKLLQICKSKIDDGFSHEELISFIKSNENEILFSKIKEEIEDYIDKKMQNEQKNKLYWMLICNPLMWGDGSETYEVNELLYNLNENNIEPWKINARTDMERQMKVGHKGIIKVSDDKRTEAERCDDEGEIVDKLDAGIYGIFEVVEDEDGDCTYETEDGYYLVNIKVIDNFYRKGINISKEKSRELLGVDVYNSIPSRKIDKNLFDRVVNYQTK